MTNLRTYTFIFLVIFVLITVFGLYFPTMSMSGDSGCPFAVDGTALCAQPLAHIEHWQNNFLTVLVEVLALAALVLVAFFTLYSPQGNDDRDRYRLRSTVPIRPTLFQELFARGILNRRAP